MGSINAELMPEYFHATYIFGCKINTAISANKPKYTFLFVTSVYSRVYTSTPHEHFEIYFSHQSYPPTTYKIQK